MADSPRIKRAVIALPHSPDRVEFRIGVWNAISHVINDESESGVLYQLVSRLDGTRSARELARELGVPRSQVESLLDSLTGLGVLELGPSSALDDYLDDVGRSLQMGGSRIPPATPLQLVGSPALVRDLRACLSGVVPDEHLCCPDADDPRWRAITDPDDTWLLDSLRAEERWAPLVEWKGSIVVYISETLHPGHCLALNRALGSLGIPWLHAVLDGPFLLIGPTFVPGRSPCWECLETRVTMNLREHAAYQTYKRLLVQGQVEAPSSGPTPLLRNLLASHAALEATNLYATGNSFTVGKMLGIYLPTMEFSFSEVFRVPGCPGCGARQERDQSELYFTMQDLWPSSLPQS